MPHFDRRRPRRHHPYPREEQPDLLAIADPGSTDMEAPFLRSLVDSRASVTVVLKNGEMLRGRVRYYDRDCFSVGQAGGGPNIFLRKNSVLYILED